MYISLPQMHRDAVKMTDQHFKISNYSDCDDFKLKTANPDQQLTLKFNICNQLITTDLLTN